MPAIQLSGTLTKAANKTHVPLEFMVPEGVSRLTGRFASTPKRSSGALFDNLISLSLFGPNGSRGARHNNPVADFELDACHASPGYLPGAIDAGKWTVYLDIFRLLGPDSVHYQLDIEFGFEAVAADAKPQPAPLRQTGPGWYRGDLHAHTLHSDGKWDVPDLVAHARNRQLDFITLTDHNTVSGLSQMDQLAGDDLLTMGGIELTTHYGHCLALGARQWQEWRANSNLGVTMPTIAANVMATGALFVIAHPFAPGDPSCTGCRWEYQEMMPGNANIVEIWNSPWSEYNEEGLAAYYAWARTLWREQGRKLVMTGGSDIHGPHEATHAFGFNHVLAAQRTQTAILAGVAAGHNYISSGPSLLLEAVLADGRMAMMGDHVEATGAGNIKIGWGNASAGNVLHVMQDGKSTAAHQVKDTGEMMHAVQYAGRSFLNLELRSADGQLRAITNPLFFG